MRFLSTALWTIGFSLFASHGFAAEEQLVPGVKIDKEKKLVAIDAKIAPRKLPMLDQVYPIEVVASWSHDRKERKGLKAHETVVTFDVLPSDVHKALEAVGLKPGAPVKGGEVPCKGPDINVFIEMPADGGSTKRLSMDKVLMDPKSKLPFPKAVKFRFTGSVMSKIDPNLPETKYGADLSGTLIVIYPVSDETVCQSTLTMKEEKFLKLETNAANLPKEGTAVRLILEAASK
ncbi:MAG: YdjY domain-containing protein [Planctomycetes bacterium]|nr:YdjY domain-containing protein [Planctomycetota bacterium]